MQPYIILPPPPKPRTTGEVLLMLALWTGSALVSAAAISIGYTLLY